MQLEFHGANRNVTGSCHLVRCNGNCILIDCGMFQGGREMDKENRGDFGFKPKKVDFLLLTHGHLDHCGRIPLLVKRGFRGKIFTSSATRELARLVMFDSARIQENEAAFKNRKLRKRGKPEDVVPLYTSEDAQASLEFFHDINGFDRPIALGAGITVSFFEAGHILGAASILLELSEQNCSKRILFSGDLGYSDRVILRDPATPPKVDIVVMETTYGDRTHKQFKPSIHELYQAIAHTREQGGNVLIPSFALERTQEILYALRDGIEQGLVSDNIQVFLDSPMAISATEIFRNHPECFDDETLEIFKNGDDPFGLPGLHFTRETEQSIELKKVKRAVIIAGSGMCTGGRIRHHLRENLWRREAAVVFVGYAAYGTLARRIIDGQNPVTIFGSSIEVRARIYTIGGFSAHADQQDLLRWHQQTGSPEHTFLVHGEEKAMKTFSGLLKNTRVEMPQQHQVYEV